MFQCYIDEFSVHLYKDKGCKRTKIIDFLYIKICSHVRKCGVIECDKMILTGLERTVSLPFSLYLTFISLTRLIFVHYYEFFSFLLSISSVLLVPSICTISCNLFDIMLYWIFFSDTLKKCECIRPWSVPPLWWLPKFECEGVTTYKSHRYLGVNGSNDMHSISHHFKTL